MNCFSYVRTPWCISLPVEVILAVKEKRYENYCFFFTGKHDLYAQLGGKKCLVDVKQTVPLLHLLCAQQTSWMAEGHDLSPPEMVTSTPSSPPAEAPEDPEQKACPREISTVAPAASPVSAEPLLDTSAAEEALSPPTSGE